VAKYNINNLNAYGFQNMNKERHLIIMNKKDKNNNGYFTDEDYLDMASTSSANECTGLISQGGNETDSAKQYNDLYQFGVPHVAAKATVESFDKTSTSSSDKLLSKPLSNSSDKLLSKPSSNSSDKSTIKHVTTASNKSSTNHK